MSSCDQRGWRTGSVSLTDHASRVLARAADELPQEWMHRLARKGTDLRLKQAEHEEPVLRQLDYLGSSVVGGRLDHHAALNEAPNLLSARTIVAVVHAD